MGRSIDIYQIDQNKFSEHISTLLHSERWVTLQNWMTDDREKNDPEQIIKKMASGSINAKDLSLIITWAWNEVDTTQQLSDLGIEPFWEITGTSASCTFMEEWHHFFEDNNTEVDFFIAGSDLILFLSWLDFLSDIFHQKNTKIGHPQWYDRAMKIWEIEKDKKFRLGDEYSGKWKIDYFNFLYFDFHRYLKILNKNAVYFLIDSY